MFEVSGRCRGCCRLNLEWKCLGNVRGVIRGERGKKDGGDIYCMASRSFIITSYIIHINSIDRTHSKNTW